MAKTRVFGVFDPNNRMQKKLTKPIMLEIFRQKFWKQNIFRKNWF